MQTILRVHAIPNVMSFIDYSPAATGMTYRNELNPNGVTVDGVPDAVTPGVPDDVTSGGYAWEQMSGKQGTVSVVTSMIQDFDDISVTNYYLDQKSPSTFEENQCTGDAFAYGASGAWIDSPLPNTDPVLGPAKNLTSKRTLYYEDPAAGGAADAQRREDEVANPLRVRAKPMKAGKPKLKLKARPAKVKAAPGERFRASLTVRNKGNDVARRVRVCGHGGRRVVRTSGNACAVIVPVLDPGDKKTIRGSVEIRGAAREGNYRLRFSAKAKGAKRVRDSVRLKIG